MTSPEATEGEGPTGRPAKAPRNRRDQRGAGWRWAAGLAVALGFHFALVALTHVELEPRRRLDRIDPRITWVGDKAVLEEDTLQGQQLQIFTDAPLFLPTAQNFASTGRRGRATLRPGEIFSGFEPVLIMPVDRSPPGLVVAPTDRLDPVQAVQSFRWPYFERFGRVDPAVRAFEARQARIEVRSGATGALVLAESLPLAAANRETPEVWPDWRPFELVLIVAEAGRVSEPTMPGGGSGSDRVDQFMRDHVRRRMRLDLRLSPGSYRILVGP